MRNQKGISLINLVLVLVIIIIGVILIKNFIGTNSMENIVLTKDNFEETMDKYSEKKKGTDDIVYFGYAVMYYTTRDGMSNLFNPEATEEDAYVNVYGKTIKDLKNEGKTLMEKNNITVEQFKKKLQ